MAGQNFILSSEIFPCSEAIYIIYTRYISKSEKPKDGGGSDMYGKQFMRYTRGRLGQIGSSLQFWRGRLKIVNVGA